MERKGDKYFKSEKNREAPDDKSGNRKRSPVFGMEKDKIVDENENSDSGRGKNDAGARQAARKAETFERFLEDEHDDDGRKEREKKTREPKCLAVCRLRKNEAHRENQRGAKTDESFPPGEFFALFCFDEL